MAYFSNGTEGMMYEEEHCEKCKNFKIRDADVPSCPILDAHFFGNGDQFCGEFNVDSDGSKTPRYATEKEMELAQTIRLVLALFIPEKDGFADKCSMFDPK